MFHLLPWKVAVTGTLTESSQKFGCPLSWFCWERKAAWLTAPSLQTARLRPSAAEQASRLRSDSCVNKACCASRKKRRHLHKVCFKGGAQRLLWECGLSRGRGRRRKGRRCGGGLNHYCVLLAWGLRRITWLHPNSVQGRGEGGCLWAWLWLTRYFTLMGIVSFSFSRHCIKGGNFIHIFIYLTLSMAAFSSPLVCHDGRKEVVVRKSKRGHKLFPAETSTEKRSTFTR